jgi:hypothetical protein
MSKILSLQPTALLDPDKHDRAAFSCGVSELDQFLAQRARKESDQNLSKTFVLTAKELPGRIIGYYTISPKHINTSDLPSELTRKLPRYNELGVTLLGRLAIDQDFATNKGLGSHLLTDVKYKVWGLQTGSFGIVVDVLIGETGDPTEFYLKHDFIQFSDTPNKLFLPMKTIQQTLKAGGLIE